MNENDTQISNTNNSPSQLVENSARLTKKQKEFADEYLETGNRTEAALKAYDTTSENSAAVIGSQNLRKVKIQRYLEDKAERASQVIFELLENAQNETVKLNAGKDILDRAGFKPIDKQEHSGTISVEISEAIANKNKLYASERNETN